MENKLDELLAAIAKKHMGVPTLEKQNSDEQDFHSCAVWSIKKALETAFNAGAEVGISMALDEAKRK